MIRKHKNNSPSNWMLVNKLFPISHKRWERFGRPIDGYHVNWITGKWKNAKTRVTFCSLGTKRSPSCVVQLQVIKRGFILRIPTDRFELFTAWKRVRIPKEITQIHFPSWQYSNMYSKTDSRYVGSTQLGSSTQCDLVTRLDSFRLPLVCIDDSRTCWASLSSYENMKKWFAVKWENFFWRSIHKLP